MKIENKKAFSEVNAILKQLDNKVLQKVPSKILTELEKNAIIPVEYIKPDIPLEKLKLEEETRELLAVISYSYFCTEEEKKEWEKLLTQNEQIYQQELSRKYNINNLFKTETQKIQEEVLKESKNKSLEMIEYKESFLKKIIKNLKKYLKNS